MHLDGPHIWTGIIVEGATELMIKGNGFGYSWNGHYVPACGTPMPVVGDRARTTWPRP